MARPKGAKNKPKEEVVTPTPSTTPTPVKQKRNYRRQHPRNILASLKIDTNVLDQMETTIQNIKKNLQTLADLSTRVSFQEQPLRGRPRNTKRNQRNKNRPKQEIQREKERKDFEQKLRSSLDVGNHGRIPVEKRGAYTSQLEKWDKQHQASV